MRILLVGDGPPAGPDLAETRFCSLRLAQFEEALAGHDVHVVDCRWDDARIARAVPGRVDAVVSAGVYGPTRLATRLAGDAPLWIDLAGDPFADAQAWAWAPLPAAGRGVEEVTAERAARVDDAARDSAAVFVPALQRADVLSAVSGPSRHALVGALGALGRTVRTPPGEELVHVVPVAWAFGGLREGPRRAPRVPTPDAPLRVLLAGSLNTWFDQTTALLGLFAAMGRAPVEVDVVGGAVPGHHDAGEAELRARVAGSRYARRFRFHGWVSEAELARIVAACDVGLCLDRPGYEPELGSRTRVLFFLHQGLRVVATATSELTRELARDGFLAAVRAGDVPGVADALLRASPVPDRAPLRARYATRATTAALSAWAAAPRRATFRAR